MSEGAQTAIVRDTAKRAVRVSTRTAQPSATIPGMAFGRTKAKGETSEVPAPPATPAQLQEPETPEEVEPETVPASRRIRPTHDDEW